MSTWIQILGIVSALCAGVGLSIAGRHAAHFEKSRQKGHDQNVGL